LEAALEAALEAGFEATFGAAFAVVFFVAGERFAAAACFAPTAFPPAFVAVLAAAGLVARFAAEASDAVFFAGAFASVFFGGAVFDPVARADPDLAAAVFVAADFVAADFTDLAVVDFAATVFAAAAGLRAARADVVFGAVLPRDVSARRLPVAAFFAEAVSAPVPRAVVVRAAMASPRCKTGARRNAAHSRGWQEYGSYARPPTVPRNMSGSRPSFPRLQV
jgi:hypothetical protein